METHFPTGHRLGGRAATAAQYILASPGDQAPASIIKSATPRPRSRTPATWLQPPTPSPAIATWPVTPIPRSVRV